ncbi:LORF2 protein, partial [Crocuta crocuta]
LKTDHRPTYKTESYKIVRRQRRNLDDLGFGHDFGVVSPKMGFRKERVVMLDLIKMKNCSVKRMKKTSTVWEKITIKGRSDKRRLSKIYKELLKLNNKKTDNPIKKWGKNVNRLLIKQDTLMA